MFTLFEMRKILFFALLLCCSFILKAQNNNVDSSILGDVKLTVMELFIPYQPKVVIFNPNYDDLPQDPASFMKPISFKSATTICVGDSCKNFSPKPFLSPFTQPYNVSLINTTLPAYTQGVFCDFEDHINRKRQLRIDFSVK